MSDGKQRNRKSGGGGGGNQRRRRRNRDGNPQQGGQGQGGAQAPRGPVMTSLGESTYEAVFDHGTEGYGVWFDGMVRDDPMYRQHWKGNRPIYVKFDDERIVITRDLPAHLRDDKSGSEAASERDSDRDSDRDTDVGRGAGAFANNGSSDKTGSIDTMGSGGATASPDDTSATNDPGEVVSDSGQESEETAPRPRRTRVRRKPVDTSDDMSGAHGDDS